MYELNTLFYHLFYHFAKKYTILNASGITSPAVFNGFTISYIHSINTVILQIVFSKIGQVLEAGNHGSIEVHMFQLVVS